MVNSSHRILDMEFPERLSAIRKEKGLTQQKLAKLVGLHVAQVRRYEGGTSQPTFGGDTKARRCAERERGYVII
ncbi:MAG: helix-turn-helix transcriptional regulator [Desulfofustis sp. PB-SRB1]|nr:helix-turn-helix transcriptional regulator [Desulfofustis sp. PB-SRB1]